MSEKREVLFILDGLPMAGETCSLTKCFDPATGLYEMVYADTMEFLAAVVLCAEHGKKLATGPSA